MFKSSLFLALISVIFPCAAQDTNSTLLLVNRTTTLDSVQLDSTNIEFQFRGNCYAFNSKKNDVKSGGEAHSQNLALTIDSTFERNGNYLFLNSSEYSTYYNGFAAHTLYLVNTTDDKISYGAQDSRLNIVAEAMDENGNWNAISYLPSSWCGNSYHEITLDKDEYWSFKVPVFKGSFETKLRYVLGGETPLISNEIVVRINPTQFDSEKKQGHTPTGIMDSYND